MGELPGPVTINASGLRCGLSGYPAGAAVELLDGSLKLRHRTTSFSGRFPPGLFLYLVGFFAGGIAGKRDGHTTYHFSSAG